MLRDLLAFAFAWYNLPFTVLFAMGILLAGLQLTGLGAGDDAHGDADHDADLDQGADLDHDAGLDHDVHLDHDADLDQGADFDQGAGLDHGAHLDHDADVDHGAHLDHDADLDHAADGGHAAEHESGAGAPGSFSLLAFLGAGKAPLLVVLLILFESVALLGWLLNGLLAGVTGGAYPGPALFAVLPGALVIGSLVTARMARWVGHALPPISTTASRAQSLVGAHGTVISPLVDEQYGMVHLRDAGSTLITIFAVVQGEAAIKRGSEVILLAYDPVQRRYIVTLAQPPLRDAGR